MYFVYVCVLVFEGPHCTVQYCTVLSVAYSYMHVHKLIVMSMFILWKVKAEMYTHMYRVHVAMSGVMYMHVCV
jgi:hypothetical protein